MKNMINVYNEWDPLEEIIVGTAINCCLPTPDRSVHAVDFPDIKRQEDIPHGPLPKQVIEETEEDLSHLTETLEGYGIKVRRPDISPKEGHIKTFDWEARGVYYCCPRDVILTMGNNLIESPSPLRFRLLEHQIYHHLFVEYLRSGCRWISAPRPQLLDGDFKDPHSWDNCLNNNFPIFDAANILRLGRDILYLVSSSANVLGAQWLQAILGPDYKVHLCKDKYNHKHIDTTFSVIKPGLVLINPERIKKDEVPEVFKKWDKIWCPDLVDIGHLSPALSSIWIGMNILTIKPGVVIADRRQVDLIAVLEKNKVEVIPLVMRHARAIGGGFHCVTCDVRRTGTLESYC
jgi:hypothetical protein